MARPFRCVEREPRLGGHAHTQLVTVGTRTVPVDSGFMVFNERTYPHFVRLLADLGVESRPSDMSFSVQCARCDVEYSSVGLRGLFARPRHAPGAHLWLPRHQITVSEEQRALASARVAAPGLAGQVAIELRDYRDIEGQFQRIVSVEMIEAVGHEFWPGFFQAIDRALAPGGRVGIQAIAIPDGRFDQYVQHADWIQKHIFPGGLLPCLREVCAVTAAHTRLGVTGVEDRPLDYAATLEAWRTRFFDRIDEVRRMGFDDRFIRTWEYYLASCEAAARAISACCTSRWRGWATS